MSKGKNKKGKLPEAQVAASAPAAEAPAEQVELKSEEPSAEEVVVAAEPVTLEDVQELVADLADAEAELANPDDSWTPEYTTPVTEPTVEETPAAVEEAKAPLFSTVNPDDAVLDIVAACGEMLDGYKESWTAAVRAKAKSMGVGEKATRREWRGVFIAWGGVQILK